MPSNGLAILERARDIMDAAQAEDRQLTDEEARQVKALHARAKDWSATEKELNAISGGGSPEVTPGSGRSMLDGWGQVADEIAKGQKHVELETSSLLGKARGSKDLSETDLVEGVRLDLPTFSVIGADARFLYSRLNTTVVGTELSVSDYRQTGDRTVSGDVERDLTATTEKATLDLEVEHVSTPLKQVAIVIDGIPNALFGGVQALRPFLASEGQYQLSRAIDAHVLATIEDADVLSGEPAGDGASLEAQIRYAIGAHRSAGYNPTVAALDPTDAAELDLTSFEAGYTFNVQRYGSSSPLFSLDLVEVAAVTDPLLIDVGAVGTLALGPTKVDVDTSQGFTKNTSSLRVEASVLFVLRNESAIYAIGGGS